MTLYGSRTAIPLPLLFAAALVAGASFWPASHLLAPGVLHVVWKGSGVALLALWALICARGRFGRLAAAVLACGAIGDVLLDVAGVTIGALAFLLGHVLAVVLYRRFARRGAGPVGAAVFAVLLLASWALAGLTPTLIYAAGLAAMAGTATASAFPRRVAFGALLFAASDLLLFAHAGPLSNSPVPPLLIWPLYFAGQALIAHGVVTTLAREKR